MPEKSCKYTELARADEKKTNNGRHCRLAELSRPNGKKNLTEKWYPSDATSLN
jgi:hypothetical protein